jgi:hypothetical protein
LWHVDPANAKRRLAQATTQVDNLVRTLGITLPAKSTYWAHGARSEIRVADIMLRNGWDQDQLVDYLLSQASYDEEGIKARGGIGATMREIRAIGQQFMLPPNDWWTFRHAKRVLGGESTLESISADFAASARTRFGDNETMLGIIDRGGTPSDYFDPIRQAIGQELDKPASSIDLISDDRFRDVVDFAGDDGRLRPMTLSEAVIHTRKLGEWGETTGAKRKADEAGLTLLKLFGKRK